jgi:hypothetical protein
MSNEERGRGGAGQCWRWTSLRSHVSGGRKTFRTGGSLNLALVLLVRTAPHHTSTSLACKNRTKSSLHSRALARRWSRATWALSHARCACCSWRRRPNRPVIRGERLTSLNPFASRAALDTSVASSLAPRARNSSTSEALGSSHHRRAGADGRPDHVFVGRRRRVRRRSWGGNRPRDAHDRRRSEKIPVAAIAATIPRRRRGDSRVCSALIGSFASSKHCDAHSLRAGFASGR